jgi:hypothetical protein
MEAHAPSRGAETRTVERALPAAVPRVTERWDAAPAGSPADAGQLREGAATPLGLRELVARARARPRPFLVFEALIVAWLAWVYDMLTDLAPTRAHLALANGAAIWHAERVVGIDPELALNRWLSAHITAGQVASYYYDNAHFIVTIGLFVLLWWKRPGAYRPLRSTLVLVNLIGFAVFWFYPVAPPRMLGGAGFWDVVGHSGTFGQWHTGSLATSADQFAAMPSLHVAWALWCSLVMWRIAPARAAWRRTVRALAILYPSLTTLVVFATGNHYVLDVLAGVVTIALAAAIVELLPASRASRGLAAASSLA